MVTKSFYRKRKFALSGIDRKSENFELWGVGWGACYRDSTVVCTTTTSEVFFILVYMKQLQELNDHIE